ncbi:hypothetical protein SBDP1_70018 [Syntrophobacter sp. SbD1]|nr:hypothetical protein SBDP1_70018 [Syntrophobacter sp. SbD1]
MRLFFSLAFKNVSGTEHNFTLNDPGGKILTSVDLPVGQNIRANVELSEPGVYKFYCDRTFHSTPGMNGQIIVGR